MTSVLSKVYDHRNANSWAFSLRQQRFSFFQSLLVTVPTPIKILDVGGTSQFWQSTGWLDEVDLEVTLLNVSHPASERVHPRLHLAVGDARNMPQFSNQSFDVVFSNSVIEHVGTLAEQRQMATEVMRIGQRYFIQTPNRYFPIEPHFVFPCFQFLPVSLKVWLVTHFQLGWYERIPDPLKARQAVSEISLMTKRELISLFPNSNLYEEKLAGWTKSFIVYAGWSD